MVLEKLINVNRLMSCIFGGMIAEYDIAHAGASAMLELKGVETYEYLLKLDKKNRNIKIGLMMRAEPGLAEAVNELMLKYLNTFIRENKIKSSNIVNTTRDSILIYNKIPMKLNFNHVEFRNKDGIFSTMLRIKNYTILFDSMTGRIMMKGVKDEVVEQSGFLKDYLINHLYMIENCQKSGDERIFNILKNMRESYLESSNINIYKDLLNENKLGVRYNDELLYLDVNTDNIDENEDFVIAKDLNFVNFVLPIMRSVILNG